MSLVFISRFWVFVSRLSHVLSKSLHLLLIFFTSSSAFFSFFLASSTSLFINSLDFSVSVTLVSIDFTLISKFSTFKLILLTNFSILLILDIDNFMVFISSMISVAHCGVGGWGWAVEPGVGICELNGGDCTVHQKASAECSYS